MKTYQAEPFSSERFRLAEAPHYDARSGRLSWVDILDGKLFLQAEDGSRDCLEFGQKVGSAVPLQRSDGFVIAGEKGLYLAENGSVILLCDLSDSYLPYQRSNDAKADPDGRIWFGSIVDDMDHFPAGNLYCYDHGALRVGLEGTKLANGMAWNRAGTRFFFIDSMDFAVYAFDYDRETGTLSNQQLLCKISSGIPDGMCIDAADDLWIAVWGGRVEHRSGRTGELLGEIRLPAERVTSCCFIGSELDTLFITTFGDGMDGPDDGGLFLCKTGVRGCAADPAVID